MWPGLLDFSQPSPEKVDNSACTVDERELDGGILLRAYVQLAWSESDIEIGDALSFPIYELINHPINDRRPDQQTEEYRKPVWGIVLFQPMPSIGNHLIHSRP